MKKVMLAILDGVGIRDEVKGNAFKQADKPCFDYLISRYPHTISGDGEELDAYIVGVFEPVEEFEGRVIAIIHRTNDDDDKLIVAPKGVDYSDDAIRALTEFQERFFKSVIIR